jgi:hypothetical protein
VEALASLGQELSEREDLRIDLLRLGWANSGLVEVPASLGRELSDREDLRMELLRLEVRKGQQWTG